MPATPAAIRTVILARLRARQEREHEQRQLLKEEDDFHETIRVKLYGLWDAPQFWNFSRCGSEDFFRTCRSCGDVQQFKYRCSIKWCPRCQWRITAQRKKILALWTTRIAQPKHLVLTQKNFPVLTPRRVLEHTRALAKMRRAKCFKRVRGGCVSVEITNEGKGWHLHSHWLIDCRWLDMPAVSRAWGKLVGQNFAVVKIMDVREQDYLREVTKYVVEGSELAKWPREKINEFVRAIYRRRFFFPFGSLFHESPGIRRALKNEKPDAPLCECGCGDFIFRDEQDEQLAEIMRLEKQRVVRRERASGRKSFAASDRNGREAPPDLF
jgi:hypothetical protein